MLSLATLSNGKSRNIKLTTYYGHSNDSTVHSSGKAPKNSTAGEAEYKALLEHLVRDLLLVADLPEWPVATLMLQVAIKSMVGIQPLGTTYQQLSLILIQ